MSIEASKLLKGKWSTIMKSEYGEGIQDIVETLTDSQLLDYIVETSRETFKNSEYNNNLITELKLQLAKEEMLKRLKRRGK